jgi:curved DNA-binding protein CbpA
MGAPLPTATGTLAKTPLPELLAYCLERNLTGSLLCETVDAPKTAVSLVEGCAVKVRVGAEELRVGRILAEEAGLDIETLPELARQSAAKGRLFGRHLLVERLISDEQLGEALRQQVERHLRWLSALGAGTTYGFFQNADLLLGWGEDAVSVDPLHHLWCATEAMADVERMRVVVRASVSGLVQLHPHARVLRFGFSKRDRAVLDVLRVKPQPLPDLIATGLLAEEQLYRVLYVLILSRHLQLATEQVPLGVSQAGSRVPLVHRTSSHFRGRRRTDATPSREKQGLVLGTGPASSFRAEIESLDARIDQLSYYEVLDVQPTADAKAIRRSFFTLARKWHPDRLEDGLDDLAPTVTRVFAKMTEAHRILGSAQQRAEYDRLQESGSAVDEQEVVQRVLRAATTFRRAEVLAKKRDFPRAEKLAEKAVQDDPDQAEYLALYAWVAAQHRVADGDTQLEDLVGLVEKAMQMQEQNMRVHYYRAVVFKLAGRDKAAQKAFRFVVENDPHNVDAARELRLFKMRSDEVEPEKRPGFISRFFKKS